MGCIFYYALAARDPFVGEDAEAIVASHLAGEAVPLEALRDDVPPAVCRWVMRLLSRQPEDRPASATAALLAFDALFAQ